MRDNLLLTAILLLMVSCSGFGLSAQNNHQTCGFSLRKSMMTPQERAAADPDSDACRNAVTQGYGASCTNSDSTIPALPFPACGKFRVPIAFRTIANDDCTGLLPDMSTRLDQELCFLNQMFGPANIEFFECSRPDPICSTALNSFDGDTEEPAIDANNILNVINIYLPTTVTLGGSSIGGYAALGGSATTPRFFVAVGTAGNEQIGQYNYSGAGCATNNSACSPTNHNWTLLAHEMGHYFGLNHTFEVAPDTPGGGTGVAELADGSTACTAGDLNGDTAPDPYQQLENAGVDTDAASACPGCTWSNPGGANDVQDANGNSYSGFATNNIMSYWNYDCLSTFTPFQNRRMYDVLQNCATYLCCNNADNYLADVNQQDITVCEGDALPEVVGESGRCYSWYADATTSTAISAGTTNLSPSDFATAVNTSIPGTYTIYLQDANSTAGALANPAACRIPITVTINAGGTNGCAAVCPTLDTAPVALSIAMESVCGTGCTPAGGSWSLDSSVCPSGSSLQTFADGTTTTGGTALTAAPGYNQTTAETYHVRCVCETDANTVSPVQTISSNPGTCTDPVATTNDVTVCSGTTSEAITVTATTGTPVDYSIDYDATAEGEGFVDVATTAIAGANYAIPAAAATGVYNGTISYTDANGCSDTDAFTITINNCATCPTDPTATVDNTMICSSGVATLALGATAGTATTANFVLNSMPMGVTFSPSSPAPEGSVTATFPANTTCDPIVYTITVGAVCSNGDDIANDPANLQVTVYPEIAAANLVVTNGNCSVAPSVTSSCSNYDISLNGDADDIIGVPTAGQSGTNDYTITYTGAPACFVNGTATATYNCAVSCPTLASAPVALSIASESVCGTGCVPAGGSWSLDSSVCPSGSSLQTFADGTTTTGGTALTTAPGYNQTTAETFHVRCVCDTDANTVSPVQTISSNPGSCTTPVATTNDVTVCSGTTSEAITVTATTGTPVDYSIDYDATAEGAGFVDVATTAIAGASYVIPSGASSGTYNGIMTYTDGNGCSGTDAFTITINTCASCPSDPTATVNNTMICSSGVATLALGATAGTATTANFVLNSMPMGVTFSPSSPAPEGSVTATFPANTTCDPIAYTITIDAVCSNGDDIANDPSNIVVTVYPEITASNLVVTNGNCSVAPSVTSSCANYDISLNGDADDITTIPTAGQSGTNNYTISYTGAPACFVNGTATATYNCAINCPNVTMAISTSESMCTGSTPTLDVSGLVIDNPSQAVGNGTVTWYTDSGLTIAYAGGTINHSGANTCDTETVVLYASIQCADDNTVIAAGSSTIAVYPAFDATNLVVTNGNCSVAPSVTSACSNYNISLNGDADDIVGVPSAGQSGTNNYTISYTGAPACFVNGTATAIYNCAINCPNVTTAISTSESICTGSTPTLDASSLVIDNPSQAVGNGTVTWYTDSGLTLTYAGSAINHSGANTCDTETVVLYASIQCADDNTVIAAGSSTIAVYPAFDATNLVVTNGNCSVAPSVTSACSNYNISLNGDADDIVGVPSAGQSGTNNYTISYTGAPACFVNGTATAIYESQFGPVGSSCDDGDNCTINDIVQADCSCAGTFADADNDGTCDANDVCANGPEPSTPCDDGDDATNNDMIQADCSCMGSLFDCAGVLNGNSTLDECGVCDDDSSNDNETCTDCAGVVNGTSTVDACGVCDDDSSNDNETCTDCAGVVNGTSTVDACGVCDDDSSNDNETCTDCAGVVNGTSTVDACGVCDDDSSNDNETCTDCAGVVNGDSELDECGICDGGGIEEGTCDCEGTPETTYYADNDNDLLGDPNNSINACEQPAGYVTNKNDLNDNLNDLECEEPIITTEVNCLGNGESFEIIINIQEAGSNATIVVIDDLGTTPTIITNEVGSITFGNYSNNALVELFIYSGMNCEGYLEVVTSDCVVETEPCDLFQIIPTVQCNDNGTFQIVTTVVGGSGNYAYSFEGGNYEELIGEEETAFVSGTYADGDAYDINVIDNDFNCEATINNTVECVKTAIELLSFEGRVLESNNQLLWVTASETDNDYFEVMKSYDGVNFEAIGKVNGVGNSTTPSAYEFVDYELTNGTTYYQLRIVDINGKVETSNVIDLYRGDITSNINIVPNPAVNYINIDFINAKTEVLSLEIYDVSGKLVRQHAINSKVGENSNNIDVENLSKGLYFLQLVGNNYSQQATFIIVD